LLLFNIDVSPIPVSFDPALFQAHDALDAVGLCVYDVEGQPDTLVFRDSLEGMALYRTYLHEVGHALGLGHTERGIMSRRQYAASDLSSKWPSLAQRRRWCHEIAVSFLRHRLKVWGQHAQKI
jgi:hypothetical protein